MNQMMKQLGINVEEIDGVEEVVIRTATKDYVFEKAEVTIMTTQGQKTYQVTGNPRVVAKSGASTAAPKAPAAAPPAPVRLEISEEDIRLVAEQTGRPPSEAKKALEATNGDIAEAILKLQP